MDYISYDKDYNAYITDREAFDRRMKELEEKIFSQLREEKDSKERRMRLLEDSLRLACKEICAVEDTKVVPRKETRHKSSTELLNAQLNRELKGAQDVKIIRDGIEILVPANYFSKTTGAVKPSKLEAYKALINKSIGGNK